MRKYSILLAIGLCLALATGCGGGATPQSTAQAPAPASTDPAAEPPAPTASAETPAAESPSPTEKPDASAPVTTPVADVEIGIEAGMRAPEFTLPMRDGTGASLEALLGKPVFINFFATWCGPCVREMPDIQAVYEEYGDRVHFLAIDLGEEKSVVDEFLDEYGFTFPVAYDYDGAVGDAYGAMYIPLTYMLDSEGIIVASVNQSTDAATMTALIEEALSK